MWVIGELIALGVGMSLAQGGLPGFDQGAKGQCDILNIGSCPAEEGCYINLANGSSDCEVPSEPGEQGDVCTFLNACTIGLGCVLQVDADLTCAHYCDPVTGATAQGQTCGDVTQIAAGSPRCVAFTEFYSNVDADGGMCLDCDALPDSIACDRLFRSGFEGN